MNRILNLWEITKNRDGYGIQKTVKPGPYRVTQLLTTKSVTEGLTFEQAKRIIYEHNEMVLDLLEKVDRATK